MIFKNILFFATLFPLIQSLQIYIFFGVFTPKVLIMPILVGSIAGYLVGYYRRETHNHIKRLLSAEETLKEEVKRKTAALEEKNKTLERLSLTDALTGLGNRVKLRESIEDVCSKLGMEYQYVSIMMIDIDYFKDYNDYYGHLEGDNVLKLMGKTITTFIDGKNMTAIRFGGEEFCLIMPQYEANNATFEAEALNKTIKNLQIKHLKSLASDVITISVGVHTLNTLEDQDQCTLIEEADRALYRAKKAGRDQVYYL